MNKVSLDKKPRLAARLIREEVQLKDGLHRARESAGMSVDELAKAMGISSQKVEALESLNHLLTFSELREYALAVGFYVEFTLRKRLP